MQQVKTVQHSTGHSFAASVTEFAFQVFGAVVRWDEKRKSVRHLQTLSNHHLKDLGIDRSEIMSVVYGDAPDRLRGYSRGH